MSHLRKVFVYSLYAGAGLYLAAWVLIRAFRHRLFIHEFVRKEMHGRG